MTKPLHTKLGVSPSKRSILVHAPPNAASTIGLPGHAYAKALHGSFDYIHLFVTRAKDLSARLPQLKQHLRAGGMLWVSWPRGRKQGTDLELKEVIRLAYDAGLVESKTIAFDETWSAIKLTQPRRGKVYRNSYGQLPEDTP